MPKIYMKKNLGYSWEIEKDTNGKEYNVLG